jgi:hypothetical protein
LELSTVKLRCQRQLGKSRSKALQENMKLYFELAFLCWSLIFSAKLNVADLDISTLQPKMSKKIRSRTSMGGGFSGGGGPGGSLRANEKQGDGPPVELENQMILR